MNTPKTITAPAQNNTQPRRPNEHGTVSVQAHVRIFDPKTQRTIVEARG
jgi:hypothetical protein